MAKKDKKKGKKQAGDWSDDEPASPATPPVVTTAADDDDDEEETSYKPSGSASRFANFSSFVDDDAGEDEEDDGGGLMAAIRSSESKKKGKKDKKKAKRGAADDEDEDDGLDGEAVTEEIKTSKAPVQMTAEELMEEEFGPTKAKGKGKGKKGKKGKTQGQPGIDDDDDFLNEQVSSLSVQEQDVESSAKTRQDTDMSKTSVPTPPTTTTAALADGAAVAAEDDGENKGVLSKKEKERLKKEKEKAKKKAQAAAKKAASGDATQAEGSEDKVPAAGETSKTEQAVEAEEGEEGEGAGTAASKNKKKKKKAAAKTEEPAVAAKPAAGKKVPAHIAALQAAMAKQKAEQEEARRREEEHRRQIEEEEARLAEIERQKEEEKRRKKEKEKAKIEQLKKEGKYMTAKQKAEAAAAKARRDAMIASGQIKVEGLEMDDEAAAAPKPKKPSYGKKKPLAKKAGTGGLAAPEIITSKPATPPAASDSPTLEGTSIAEDPTRTAEHEPTEVQEDWDAQSDIEGKPQGAAVEEVEEELDDWDAESVSDKEEAKPASKQNPTPVASKTSPKASSQNTKKAEDVKKPQQNGAPAKASHSTSKTSAPVASATTSSKKAEEEASEEDEDDSEDDDDEEDSDSEQSDSDEDDSDDDSDSDSDSDSEEERISTAKRQAAQRKAEAAARRQQKREEAIAAGSKDDLRSPICCILGHVDTGKTKLLDKIRQSNVQEGEAGGITQQIGATYFPKEVIQAKTAPLGDANIKEFKLPGLLVIDTPGHESFTNLRTRGSSLCNIAILVVDIMHGLEPQTLESIRLLRTGKTPFIVALNKIDRLYGWQATPDGGFQDSLAKQSKAVKNEFERRLQEAVIAFAEQGLNAVPYYENNNYAKNVSLVPTSAHTGEGIPDMLMLITKLTQERMSSQLMYITELECTVLEVKVVEGLGTTLDVILINGVLHEGDRIVICGLNGPIVTQVRALLTPQPLKELRVRGQYVHHSMIKAAMGIKIVAPDLEKAIAGSRLLVIGPDDEEEDLKEAVMEDLQTLASSVDKSGRGVYVQASTLGSLEALLEFLKQSKIPVSNINIGPVHKKDVTRAAAMLDKAPELAVILAFDVPVDKDAERLADENNIKIFKADIIYHLFDDFTKHNAAIMEAKRKDAAPTAVWPCKLKILKCFAKRDPIILGCDIIEGATLRVGTPLAVVKVDPETKKKTIIKLGKVTSLEINHKAMDVVKRSQVGAGVAVKIEHAVYESAKLFGRHFTEHDELVSLITRQSIDTLKEHFKEQVEKDDWMLIAKKLKPLLDIA